jgi:hypothetical protein
VDEPSVEINGKRYLLWGFMRDDRQIWVDMESDDGFGRWLTPINDFPRGVVKYIYQCAERKLVK